EGEVVGTDAGLEVVLVVAGRPVQVADEPARLSPLIQGDAGGEVEVADRRRPAAEHGRLVDGGEEAGGVQRLARRQGRRRGRAARRSRAATGSRSRGRKPPTSPYSASPARRGR